MTFRRYSKLTSSSLATGAGDPSRGEDGKSDVEGVGDAKFASDRLSCLVALLQYPTPGFRCRSSRAAELCTFLSSSRRV